MKKVLLVLSLLFMAHLDVQASSESKSVRRVGLAIGASGTLFLGSLVFLRQADFNVNFMQSNFTQWVGVAGTSCFFCIGAYRSGQERYRFLFGEHKDVRLQEVDSKIFKKYQENYAKGVFKGVFIGLVTLYLLNE